MFGCLRHKEISMPLFCQSVSSFILIHVWCERVARVHARAVYCLETQTGALLPSSLCHVCVSGEVA